MNLNLKIKIIKRYVSQADFARVVNEQESLISRVIHGRRELPKEKKQLWAKKLGSNMNELF